MRPLRRIPMDQMNNVRDLGGYAAMDGCMTQYGRFLRADSLSDLTEADIKRLEEYGIRTVIDLRSPVETEKHPSSLQEHPFIRTVSVYFMEPLRGSELTKQDTLGELYVVMADHVKSKICEIMRCIAAAPAGGILFHCTAGKDRTGITAALLLGLCGVCDEDIIADYQVSAIYNGRDRAKMFQVAPESKQAYFLSLPEDMQRLLEHLGGAQGIPAYLASCGVTQQEMDAIRKRMLIEEV